MLVGNLKTAHPCVLGIGIRIILMPKRRENQERVTGSSYIYLLFSVNSVVTLYTAPGFPPRGRLPRPPLPCSKKRLPLLPAD